MSIITFSNNFTYKYTTAKKVYCITNNKWCGSTRHINLYTVPHVARETKQKDNVILGFTDPNVCSVYVNNLRMGQGDASIEAIYMDFDDVKDISFMMKLAFTLVLNERINEGSGEDIFDIYYHKAVAPTSYAQSYHTD